MNTGQLVNAQKKVWAFQFDAASPEVNFQVQLIGITGTSITALSFQVCIEITEFEV
jgi:hypothetical protein